MITKLLRISTAVIAIIIALTGCTALTPVEIQSETSSRIVSPQIQIPGVIATPPEDVTWISPGKVMVSGMYPSARAEYIMKVHNGRISPTQYEVKYRTPDNLSGEFVQPPYNAKDWVVISETSPTIDANSTRDILVVVEIPKRVKGIPDKWEFWVAVKDATQTGMVHTELCVRWLISMRK